MKPFSKDTKKAINGAIIALVVSLIGFIGTKIYQKISVSSKAEIGEVIPLYELECHENKISPVIAYNVVAYGNSKETFIEKNKLAFDSLKKVIYNKEIKKSEINFILSAVPNCRSELREQINSCIAVKEKIIKRENIVPFIIAFIHDEKEKDVFLEKCDSIKLRIVKLNLENLYALRDAMDSIKISAENMLQCNDTRTGKLDFNMEVRNTGDEDVSVESNIEVYFRKKKVIYSITNHLIQGVPCKPTIEPGKSEVISLSLNENTTPIEDKKYWLDLIKNRSTEDVTIKINGNFGCKPKIFLLQ